ncbi:1088_t:CDS:2 [Scutellospora calospora]|uniref:1088_t:CDS:1 n=1 Tax=Scutellospora calospora TaxID=85575 RepID=A0ACA9L235_9GLOM|nr:1088_t:CDS:2 [Scutellospora calospora]
MFMFMKDYMCLVLVFTWFATTTNGATTISPAGRSYSSSVTINNKLYVFGGDPFGVIGTSQTLYLDISLIGTSNPWYLLTNIPARVSAANAVFDGNKTVFLIDHSIVYDYDISINQWHQTGANGIIPISRTQATAVIDNNGKIWYFGGSNATTNIYFNDINYFNTITYSWSLGSTVNAPTARFDMVSIFLSNGLILYIGGVDANLNYIDMAQIPIYDTIKGSWSSMNASGDIIQGRELFTAVLAPDGNIIIYGGQNIKNSPIPVMANLNTNTSPYKWTSESLSPHAPQYITGHVAALNGSHMIIALGAISKNGTFDLSQNNAFVNNLNYDIYALNLQTNVWSVNSSTAVTPTSTTTPYIIGAIVGIIISVVVVIVCVLGFIIYRRYEKRKKDKEIILIPGSRNDEIIQKPGSRDEAIPTPGSDALRQI